MIIDIADFMARINDELYLGDSATRLKDLDLFKNLVNIQNPVTYNSKITSSDRNSIVFTNTSTYAQLKYNLYLKKNTVYKLSYTFNGTDSTFTPTVAIDGNGSWKNRIKGVLGYGTKSVSFNSSDYDYIQLVFPINSDTNTDNIGTLTNLLLVEGNYEAEYTPFSAYIVESGSNSNGDFVKWSDGTMICTATFNGVVEYSSYSSSSYIYRGIVSDVKFPQEFSTVPFCFVQNNGANHIIAGQCKSVSTTEIAEIECWSPLATTTYTAIRVLAIGKWK